MKVTLNEKAQTMTIEIPLVVDGGKIVPKLSGSGKTYVLATTGGNIDTGCKFNDKPVKLGLTAYIKKDKKD